MPSIARKVGGEPGSGQRLLRRHGNRALAGRGFGPRTTDSRHHLPIAPNLLKRKFVAAAPNRVWLADITYIATGEGWLHLAAVLDLAIRKIVGWSMRDHMRTELPLAALMMAAQRQAEGLICHSDRGSQYAFEYRTRTSRTTNGLNPRHENGGTISPFLIFPMAMTNLMYQKE